MAAWSSGAPVPDSATMTMERLGWRPDTWASTSLMWRGPPPPGGGGGRVRTQGRGAGGAPQMRRGLYSLGAAIRLQPPPLSAVARHEFVGGVRAPRARLVVGEPPRLGVSPTLDDWCDERPGRLHLIAAGEQGGGTQHRLQQKTLVGVRGGEPERGTVAKVHLHRPDAQGRLRP